MTPGPAPAAGLDESVAALFPEVTSEVARRLVASAIDCFATRGYHGTTTRDISEGAGLSPAALYVHFSSKEQVLFQCSLVGHQGVLAAIRAAVSEHTVPADRLRELVRAFTLWHARYHTMCRVAQYELSALTPEHHETVAAVRRETERFVREEIQRGVDSGDFTVPEVSSAALAILSMGIDVARWFQPGRADPVTLADHYAALATAMVTGP